MAAEGEISKEILRPGRTHAQTLQDGAKVSLHLKVGVRGASSPLLDTRLLALGPFELRVGKRFVFEALEGAARTMTAGELALFRLSASTSSGFVSLATVLRDESAKKHAAECTDRDHNSCSSSDHHHDHHDDHGDHGHGGCCGALQTQKKHADLLESLGKPLDMEVEILSVNQPGEYAKDHWELSLKEKHDAIAKLKAEGNQYFAAAKYAEASSAYSTALGYIEAILLATDSPDLTPDMVAFAQSCKVPCLSNYCASQLRLGAYRDVVKYASEILQLDPANWKALCRRGQAYLETGVELELAKADLERANSMQADPALTQLLSRLQQATLAARQKEKDMFGGIFLK